MLMNSGAPTYRLLLALLLLSLDTEQYLYGLADVIYYDDRRDLLEFISFPFKNGFVKVLQLQRLNNKQGMYLSGCADLDIEVEFNDCKSQTLIANLSIHCDLNPRTGLINSH